MSNTFFSKLANRRAEAIAEIDASTFVPTIRNHLVQLFRKAHAVEPTVTGVKAGNGTVIVMGIYLKLYEDGGTMKEDCHKWDRHEISQPKHAETREFLAAVSDYSNRIHELPKINDITLDDLIMGRAKKAAIHGPNGLRVRLGRRS